MIISENRKDCLERLNKMNEELKNQLTQFLEKALDVVSKGIDTAGEQIPALLQEIVYWQLAYKISWLVFGFILLAATIYCLKRAFCLLKQASSYDIDIYWVAGTSLISGSIVFCFFGIVSLVEGFTFLKALVAPRLVIIEYLKGLL